LDDDCVHREEVTGSEAGFSLPEILLTILIVGIGFGAILGGMMTSITVSDLHRKQATADTVLRDAAERVKDPGQAYKPCATTSGPNSYNVPSAPSGYAVSVSSVEYWDGTSSNPLTFVSSCPSPDKGIQRVTVVAASSDGRANETVTIVKRTG
jgi:prepilin-type N-terminal cleavage/methylation domain-containing protein